MLVINFGNPIMAKVFYVYVCRPTCVPVGVVCVCVGAFISDMQNMQLTRANSLDSTRLDLPHASCSAACSNALTPVSISCCLLPFSLQANTHIHTPIHAHQHTIRHTAKHTLYSAWDAHFVLLPLLLPLAAAIFLFNLPHPLLAAFPRFVVPPLNHCFHFNIILT